MNTLDQYIETLLWVEAKLEFEPSEELERQSRKDIDTFLERASGLLEDLSPSDIGHNLYLSRNGHGAGFIDREFKHARELQEIAESLPHVDIYTQGGKVYIL